MGRKMKRKSQKHLLQRDAFHPSQAARRKDRHSNFILFPSLLLCLFHPFSSAAEPPRYLHLKLNSLPRTTFQSHFFPLFQSIDIIPSALFSPITLCHAVIWVIGTVPWLGLREECGGLGRCYRSSMCYLETSHGNSTACALFNFSWSVRLIVLSGEKKKRRKVVERKTAVSHIWKETEILGVNINSWKWLWGLHWICVLILAIHQQLYTCRRRSDERIHTHTRAGLCARIHVLYVAWVMPAGTAAEGEMAVSALQMSRIRRNSVAVWRNRGFYITHQ